MAKAKDISVWIDGNRIMGREAGSREIRVPCCVTLNPSQQGSPAIGVALLIPPRQRGSNRKTVDVLADFMPAPATLGNFNAYEAVLFEPGFISFVVPLTKISGTAWAGSLPNVITAPLTRTMRVQVRATNTDTGTAGPTLLFNTLQGCRP